MNHLERKSTSCFRWACIHQFTMVLLTMVHLAFPQSEWLLLSVVTLDSTLVSSLGFLKYGAGLTQGGKSPTLEEGKVIWPQEKRLGSHFPLWRVMGISNHTTEEAGWGQGMATQVLSSCSVILGATLQAPRARLGNEHMDVMSNYSLQNAPCGQ